MVKYPKGSQEAKEFMKLVRNSKKSGGKKQGAGIVDDVKKVIKSNEAKAIMNKGIEIGADMLKKKINGEGFFGNVGKALGAVAGSRGGPLGSIVGEHTGDLFGNMIDKKLGTGVKKGRGRPKKGGSLLPP